MLSSRQPHLLSQLEQNLLFTLGDSLAADAPLPGQIDRPRSGRPRRAGRSGLGQRTKVPGIGSASRPRLEWGVSPPSGPTPLVGFSPPGLRGRPVRATVSRPWSRLTALTYGWRSASRHTCPDGLSQPHKAAAGDVLDALQEVVADGRECGAHLEDAEPPSRLP